MTQSMCDQFQADLDKAQSVADQIKNDSRYGANSNEYKNLESAIQSYGGEGENNGVTVNVGTVSAGAQGTTTATDGGEHSKANPSGQQVNVTISKTLFDTGVTDAVADTVAHEGSHVADAEDWAASGFVDAHDPTHEQKEFKAYGINGSMNEARGGQWAWLHAVRGNSRGLFWLRGATGAANAALRYQMIKAMYSNWDTKAFQANTHEGN